MTPRESEAAARQGLRIERASDDGWVEAYLHYGCRPWGGVALPGPWDTDKTARRAELVRMTEAELLAEGVRVLKTTLDQPGSSDHVLPLSGGFDSRALLGLLLETAGPSAIRTVTFGTPGTLDFEVARTVAKAAGVRWEGIDLRRIPWTTGDLVAAAQQHAQPISPFATHAYNQLRRVLRPESIVWSGSFGASAGGNWYVFEEPSTTWAQAKRRFAWGKGRPGGVALTPPGYDPESALPAEPLLDQKYLNYDDQLSFFIRHGCRFVPGLRLNGHDVRTPFLHPEWVSFILCMPHHHRYHKFYRRVLLAAFPKLFRHVPLKDHRGLPLTAPSWQVRLWRWGTRLRKAPRRLIPHWPWGADPVMKLMDFERALRTRRDLRLVMAENLQDLSRRKAVSWLNVEGLWDRHHRGLANHTEALLFLASVEIFLKSRREP